MPRSLPFIEQLSSLLIGRFSHDPGSGLAGIFVERCEDVACNKYLWAIQQHLFRDIELLNKSISHRLPERRSL
jgi:hypothetical protein